MATSVPREASWPMFPPKKIFTPSTFPLDPSGFFVWQPDPGKSKVTRNKRERDASRQYLPLGGEGIRAEQILQERILYLGNQYLPPEPVRRCLGSRSSAF